MKLISMTDFVLEQGNPSNTDSQFADKIMSYANFLKQPLKLKMFVPCDEDDNVLKFIEYETWEGTDAEYNNLMVNYYNAKDKVIFEGFELDSILNGGFIIKIKEEFGYLCILLSCDYCIEDLIYKFQNNEFKLTESAIKKLGL